MAEYGSQRLGCVPKLLIFVAVVVLLFAGLFVGLVWWGVSQAEPWLSAQAMEIPHRPLASETYAELEQRVARFTAAKEQGLPDRMVLTGEELNGLIAEHPAFDAVRKHAFVRLKDGRGFVYLTLPMSAIPMVNWFAGDKHLNVVLDCSPALANDRLVLDVQQCWINDRKLPEDEVRKASKTFDSRLNDPTQSSGEQMEDVLRNISAFGLNGESVTMQTGGYGRVSGGTPEATESAAEPPAVR